MEFSTMQNQAAILTDFIFDDKRSKIKRENEKLAAAQTLPLFFCKKFFLNKIHFGCFLCSQMPNCFFCTENCCLCFCSTSLSACFSRIDLLAKNYFIHKNIFIRAASHQTAYKINIFHCIYWLNVKAFGIHLFCRCWSAAVFMIILLYSFLSF